MGWIATFLPAPWLHNTFQDTTIFTFLTSVLDNDKEFPNPEEVWPWPLPGGEWQLGKEQFAEKKMYFLQYFMEQDTFLRSDRTYMVLTLVLVGWLFVHDQKHQSLSQCSPPTSWYIIRPNHWGFERWSSSSKLRKLEYELMKFFAETHHCVSENSLECKTN